MIFLSKDGKCLWDGSGETVHSEESSIMGISANEVVRALAAVREIYSRASARLLFRSAADSVRGCDCAAPNC